MSEADASVVHDGCGMNVVALDRFRALFTMRESEAAKIIGAHGYRYFIEYFDGRVSPEVYVEKARLLVKQTGCLGGSLLDVGCGHGFLVVLAMALGVRRSVGIDIHGGKVTEARQLAEYLGVTGAEFVEYDGGVLPFGDGEFDAVSIAAALSHVRDVDLALGEMRRVLKSGGRLWVFEDNNALHWQYEKRIHPVWEYAETGNGVTSHGTSRREDGWVPYRERRQRMIAEWFPMMPKARTVEYARDTQGLVGEEIRDAVQRSLDSGLPVVVNKPFRYYAPDTGEALEYPFTPPSLRDWVAKHFGNAAVHSAITQPYVGMKGVLRRVAKVVGGVIPWAMWKTQAVYVVTATKRDSESRGRVTAEAGRA